MQVPGPSLSVGCLKSVWGLFCIGGRFCGLFCLRKRVADLGGAPRKIQHKGKSQPAKRCNRRMQ